MSRIRGLRPAVNLPSPLWALAPLKMHPWCEGQVCVKTTWRGDRRDPGTCCRPLRTRGHINLTPQFQPGMGLRQRARPILWPGRTRAQSPGGKMDSAGRASAQGWAPLFHFTCHRPSRAAVTHRDWSHLLGPFSFPQIYSSLSDFTNYK